MNIEPNTSIGDREAKRLRLAAARWLANNDPNHKKLKRIAKLRKQRAARQTRVHRRS